MSSPEAPTCRPPDVELPHLHVERFAVRGEGGSPLSPSSPPAPIAVEALFGERAREIEARARATHDGLPTDRPRLATLVFRVDRLEAEERRRLDGIATAELRCGPRSKGIWGELRCPLADLEREADGLPGLVCLIAAQRAVLTPPSPPRIMGIVNVTPDSFSDGGRYLDHRAAVEHGLRLVEEGADLLDIGGESTRPGAKGVDEAQELHRVIPVLEGLRARTRIPLSIDTTKSAVAEGALDVGADIVNDTSAGLADPRMLPLVADRGCELVLMHRQGTPRDMQTAPRYGDVVGEVLAHLRERGAAGLKSGIEASKIMLDPGIGFGKRLQDNLDLIRALPELRSLGLPVLLGVSRKSCLGALSETEKPTERVGDTAAATAVGVLLGADILRVHDVRVMSQALRVAVALRDDHQPPPFA
jgi:dihydropteroate synthase